jgi:hypothetical protein
MATDIDSSTDTNDAHIQHPFKVFKKKEYKDNYIGWLELCVERVRLLSSRDRCKNHSKRKKKRISCNCLGFLDNKLYWDAVGNWMVDFGEMNRHVQQQVVIKKIQHADYLADCIDAASQDPKKYLVFCLPFVTIDWHIKSVLV